ncbi:uncharacterized protein LOC143295368 [Babylonia areolata]|uniref:uncharacterized protein LOC143295368 n=1 Tax=Babylonia areolata TaxID=304850 RepID=UPI003FD645C1
MSSSSSQHCPNNADPPPGPGLTAVRPVPGQHFPFNLLKERGEKQGTERDGTVVVSTADLNAALDILLKHGRLIICGPPGSGKTRLADAIHKLLFSQRGYTSKNYTRFVHICHSHLLHLLKRTERTICTEDGNLGYLRCCRERYISYINFLYSTQQLWNKPSPSPDTFSSLLVLTVYPHILQDIQELDKGSVFHLADPKIIYYLTRDPLNPALTFVPDLQVYASFISNMILHEQARSVVCALLAMTLEGQGHFLEDPPATSMELERLGYRGMACHQLAELADFLRGFLIAERGIGFMDRLIYDAAGLALGRTYSVGIVLEVCDTQFMAQHIRMDPDTVTTSTYLAVENKAEYQRQLMREKLYKGLAKNAELMELCQHPSLAYIDVVQEFADFCSQQKNRLERVMNAMDTMHQLPLLYWSVWNHSIHLNHWCLTAQTDTVRKTRHLTETLLTSLLASILFAESGDSTLSVASCLVKDLSNHKFKPLTRDLKLNLPVPTFRKEDAKTRLEQIKLRLRLSLCYLGDADLPLPAAFITVDITEDSLTLQTPSKSWYLLLRLLSDKQPEEKDEKGNTVLHLAAQSGQHDVIKMVIQSGASLIAKNKKGMTPHQLAWITRHQVEKESADLESCGKKGDLHAACQQGDRNLVKVLLCQGASLTDRDPRGNTALHVACREGHSELVALLLELKADVNACNTDNLTPLQEAVTMGHQDLATFLTQLGASANAKTLP